MEKRQQRGLFTVPGLLLAFAHMFFCVIPDSVDNRITAFE